MVFNMYDHQITVNPGGISSTVCPMMEATRYYRVLSDGMSANKDRKRNRGGRDRRANTGHKEMEAGRPPEFPEFLWRLVAPEDRSVVGYNPVYHQQSEHIDTKYHWIRDMWCLRRSSSFTCPRLSSAGTKTLLDNVFWRHVVAVMHTCSID